TPRCCASTGTAPTTTAATPTPEPADKHFPVPNPVFRSRSKLRRPRCTPARHQRPSRDAKLPETVPPQLLAMVQELSRHAHTHWTRALQVGNQYGEWHKEWQRLVLYALTDALVYNYLAVGTIAACLQRHGIDEDQLLRHTQGIQPDRFVTQDALDHLAGLLGPAPDQEAGEPAWTHIGRQIAYRAQQQP
ncbi:hypothetical protein, partial [Streptomyces sp. NPDC058297]|uniref:hypothetical protein n=1 Tax=Streptomyces sp. NPDC058297 TaxID=3346433 RepID=UPI0036E348FD